jgi:hypothetical protein
MLGIPHSKKPMTKEERYVYIGFIAAMAVLIFLFRYVGFRSIWWIYLMIFMMLALFIAIFWIGRKYRWDWDHWD